MCKKAYRIAGNVCENYILLYHAKIKGFLFAELNFAFWDRAVPYTPTYDNNFLESRVARPFAQRKGLVDVR